MASENTAYIGTNPMATLGHYALHVYVHYIVLMQGLASILRGAGDCHMCIAIQRGSNEQLAIWLFHLSEQVKWHLMTFFYNVGRCFMCRCKHMTGVVLERGTPKKSIVFHIQVENQIVDSVVLWYHCSLDLQIIPSIYLSPTPNLSNRPIIPHQFTNFL